MTSFQPFPHQLTAIARITEGKPTYLGFDMGLGKSRTFIEAVKMRNSRYGALILCPASAVLVWKREIALWHPGASLLITSSKASLAAVRVPDYTIISHGLLSQKDSALVLEIAQQGVPYAMTAIDEAHAFSAPDSNRVKALIKMYPKLGHVIPLSGTPIRNHAGELYNMLSLCYPAALKQRGTSWTRYEFEEQFCKVQLRYFNGAAYPTRVIEGSKNLPRLREIIKPFMLRVRKEEVLKDLPPINWGSVPVALDETAIPAHALAEFERIVNAASVNVDPDILLRTLSSQLNADASLPTLRRLLGVAKLRGACNYIVDMLELLPPDRKVLVFAHHTDVITALRNHLAEYSPAVLTGASTPPERAEAVDRFLMDDRCRVFIGNIQAAGTAITLVGPKCKCSDVVFVESSWTPSDNAQAACRVHRIGQHDAVVARILSAAGTVDDLISAILARKAREFTELFDVQGEPAS